MLAGVIGLIVERVLIRRFTSVPIALQLAPDVRLGADRRGHVAHDLGPQGLPLEIPDIINSPVSVEYYFVTGYRLFVMW